MTRRPDRDLADALLRAVLALDRADKDRLIAALRGPVRRPRHSGREEALAMLADGALISEVATRLGVDRKTVTNWRREAGIAPTRRPRASLRQAEALDLRSQGLTWAAVGREMGVSGARAHQIAQGVSRPDRPPRK